MRPKEPITAVGQIGTDSTVELEHEFKTDATLEGIFAATYVGHEFDLRYHFKLYREVADDWVNLLTPLGKSYLTGNGENHEISVRRKVEKGDVLRITITNADTTYSYHYNARVDWDREGLELFKSLAGLRGVLS